MSSTVVAIGIGIPLGIVCTIAAVIRTVSHAPSAFVSFTLYVTITIPDKPK